MSGTWCNTYTSVDKTTQSAKKKVQGTSREYSRTAKESIQTHPVRIRNGAVRIPFDIILHLLSIVCKNVRKVRHNICNALCKNCCTKKCKYVRTRSNSVTRWPGGKNKFPNLTFQQMAKRSVCLGCDLKLVYEEESVNT